MSIGVVAKLKVKSKYLKEVYNELKALHKLTHELDEGCIQYDLNQDIEDEQIVIFVEVWKDKKSLEKHMKKEHFLNFQKNINGKLDSLEINKTIKKL